MNPELITTAISGVVSLITTVLPLIHKGPAGSAAMGGVVNTLTAIAPLVVDQVGTVFTGVKNVIDSIGAHPATTAAQRATLADFDKQVDDAWNAIESQIDPDSGQIG
jgi:hypothetical protein